MKSRYKSQGGSGDLEEAISLSQQALELHPVGHTNRSLSLCNLANCIQSRYESQGVLGDLEEAISLHQQALGLHPVGHPHRSSSLFNLASCMKSRYQPQGALEDLEKAIFLLQQALKLYPVGHPNRSSSLFSLANCMESRYKSQRALEDLEEAISLYQQALELQPAGHPERSSFLGTLANCIQYRYWSQKTLRDLEDAISLHQQALQLYPVGHPNKSSTLLNLAECLQYRYQSQGTIGDLEDAISLSQQALKLHPVGHPKRSSSLIKFANCMIFRYHLQGALGDLEEAISLNQLALECHPVGDPDRSPSLVNLGNCMKYRYEAQGTLGDLDEAISLSQQALELCPIGHQNRSPSLVILASCTKSRYLSQGKFGDLEEAISLNQEALELHPVGHPSRAPSLCNLANCIHSRYMSKGALGDLEEAISLHQQVLEFHPVGHPIRPSSLHNLANCMKSRYESQGALGDLEEAISLLQQALKLYPVGHPNRAFADLDEAISLNQQALELFPVGHLDRSSPLASLANCMQCKYELQGALGNLEEAISLNEQANQLINNLIQDTLHNIPPRLIQTHSGILLVQDEMVAQFQASAEYQTLVTLLQRVNDWHSTINHMQMTIASYFQYATLSHRWGSNELLLEDILHNGSIYDMPPIDGLTKLQKFCHTVAHHGYSWAWSDTCCINKKNSVELQKAIGSMFLWYQQSALTIVYLADISSTSLMTLSGSVWFTRGWTLQELLAPQTMLLYTENWSLYMNSTANNHKQDPHILNQLAQAAGIPPKHLSNFKAGMDSTRSRLQWAVRRQTTVLEDIAYSLHGIFNLHMPVLYGEGKEKALWRLLKEILSQSHDISVLHWVGEQSSIHSCLPSDIQVYQPLPKVQPDPTPISIQKSMSRLQQLVSADSASRLYDIVTNLPQARFTDYTLTLPCIVHRIHVVKLRRTYMDHHTYDVQAVGLRPVQIITTEQLDKATDPTKPLPYVLIRPWDRQLLSCLEEDHVMAGYNVLMELEKPFIALMLRRLPEGEYRRICASRHIIVRPDDPARIVNSEIATLDII
ncbi:hypothetical protein ID866_5679 [Astraeus odoratus]|nr:hypothetical protein ID866_5679 [Astraeus odoratus]